MCQLLQLHKWLHNVCADQNKTTYTQCDPNVSGIFFFLIYSIPGNHEIIIFLKLSYILTFHHSFIVFQHSLSLS